MACPSSPLSLGSLPPDSPLDPPQDDVDSPLSTLSPMTSFETNDASYDVKYSWSGGISTIDDRTIRNDEFGQEVTVVDEIEKKSRDVPLDLIHGATSKVDAAEMFNKFPKAGKADRYEDTPKAGITSMYRATPKAGTTSMYASTPKAGTPSMYESTPKAGTANSRFDETPKAGKAAGMIGQKRHNNGKRTFANIRSDCANDDQNHFSTPSWDIDKTFSSRKKDEDNQQTTHQPNQSQSSFSGIWDFMSAIGLSRSESMQAGEDGANLQGDSSSETNGPCLTESKENDLFAMEIGLMFSTDEGDTINDPSTLYSQNASTSFTIESEMSANHSPAYDLAKYLRYRRENGLVQNDDDATKGEESLYTAGQSTIRDDHGNKVPENAKMIMGYDLAKRRKVPKKQRDQLNQALMVQKTDGAPKEMERRLRSLAGQISSDWRDPEVMPPALARRLRDFQFAREKRRKKYGQAKPWGILGLYDHLSGVKIDVHWAEEAARRRKNGQSYLAWGDYEAMKKEGFNRPFFTFLIVSACTAMMFTSILVNDWKFEPLSVNPMIGPSADTLIRLGAKDSYLIVVQEEIWRLVSPMVLHAGLIHFLFNMLALWFVGSAIEQIHGFFPAVVQFVVPAIGGTILSAIFLPEYITVGASGGIFGLIGACISDIIMNWNLLFNEFANERGARISHARVLVVLFFDIVLNCIIGLTPFVDNFTHLGGMVYGFLCGLSTIQLVTPKFLGKGKGSDFFYKCKLLFFRSFGLLVCVAGIIASSVVLFSGDGETNPCTTCTHMSCMAFPPWNGEHEKWWYCDDCTKASAEARLDTVTGKFIELNIKCPNGKREIVDVDDSWPQESNLLEGMLPMLCREHCIW